MHLLLDIEGLELYIWYATPVGVACLLYHIVAKIPEHIGAGNKLFIPGEFRLAAHSCAVKDHSFALFSHVVDYLAWMDVIKFCKGPAKAVSVLQCADHSVVSVVM
jgi:hypothetical protein